MNRPVGPGNRGADGPSVAEPTSARTALDIGRPRDPSPLARPPEHAAPEPKRIPAAARRLLARLVPGHAGRRAADFDAAAREAYHAALKLETGAPLAAAPPAGRSASAPASAPPTAAIATSAAVDAPAARPFSPPTTSATAPATAPASEPTTPDAAPSAALGPGAVAHASTWVPPPGIPGHSSAPGRQPSEAFPARPRRRKPGETAPDFLLQAPTGVAPVADDFFDSLIRQVEGDR